MRTYGETDILDEANSRFSKFANALKSTYKSYLCMEKKGLLRTRSEKNDLHSKKKIVLRTRNRCLPLVVFVM